MKGLLSVLGYICFVTAIGFAGAFVVWAFIASGGGFLLLLAIPAVAFYYVFVERGGATRDGRGPEL